MSRDDASIQRPENRLARETSAYLLQHRHNPVDWHAWGEEALERARAEDKPLLVSIGYSACHWCHVMERESFDDEETAALMNRHFVCIKVDREERPDIDQIYMDTVVKLTGQGGWPLTVFCRPDGSPFYAGTYYPDEPRMGMPSFRQVLRSMADAYREQRSQVDEAAGQILEALSSRLAGSLGGALPPSLLAERVREGARMIMRAADLRSGGFGPGPKFPTPTNLELLLGALDFFDEGEAQKIANHCALTCRVMSRRGLYDHLAGGFHRYCVDAGWTIPHFEKMLYDQGLLLRVYAEVWRRSRGNVEMLWPIRETIGYLSREMTSPEGGFYASQDADAEGEEGKFHVWTPEQIEATLGDRAAAFCRAYGVTAEGNFEHGTTHLIDESERPRAEFAAERAELLAVRSRRVPPATDFKRVAAWNGYAISGLARAGSLMDDEGTLALADRAMSFVQDEMVDDDGRLFRIHSLGRASVPAFLDDHAALLDACLDLYRAGAGERHLAAAVHFAEQICDRFFDQEEDDLYFTPSDGERLVHRPQSDHDGATPAAAGLAVLGLLRIAHLSGWRRAGEVAERVLARHALALERTPHAFPTLLRAAALLARGLSVAVVIGDPRLPATQALALRARRLLLPEDAVVVVAPGEPAPAGVAESWIAMRAPIEGEPTAFVCRGSQCSLPVTNPDDLVALPEVG